MTIGQRIAQKRKELGLSQEGLGEELGVSRQAIYKWESDATLPEIDKLIALSRRFEVSVGWLLGEENDAAPAEDGDLTDTQLHMVEEIVARYLAAQPEPPKKRRWPRIVLAAAVCLALVIAGSEFLNRLAQVTNQYSYLQNSINDIQSNVSLQINTITDRVEEILKSQNDLTADYSTALVSTDVAGRMATFSFTVRPKTWQDGMTAWIDVVNGSGSETEGQARVTIGPFEASKQVFSGEVTVALTDQTVLYIVFEQEGVRQTQLLDVYTDLYRHTFPTVWVDAWPLYFDIDSDAGIISDTIYADLTEYKTDNADSAAIQSYRMGLFADRELVVWFEPTVREYILNGEPAQEETFLLDAVGMELDREKEYVIAAVVVDEYGREFVVTDAPAVWTGDSWSSSGQYDIGPFFEGWKY